MATDNKDFRVKNGLVVEGNSATVGGNDVLTDASSIDDLVDVNTSGAANGQALIYNDTTSTFEPGNAPTGPTGPAGATGPTGPQGEDTVVISPTAPADTDVLWADTSEEGDAVLPTGGSAGQVLVKDSGTDYDASWVPSLASAPRKGFWHAWGGRGAGAGAQFAEGPLRVSAFYVQETVTVDAVAARIGTSGTGSTGAVLRIGFWDSGSNGLPNNLMLDAGTVDGTQPTGTVLSITGLSLVLTPGTYWLGGVQQGGAVTRPFFQGLDSSRAGSFVYTNSTADTPGSTQFDTNSAVIQSGVTGAFGSTFTSSPSFGGGIPYVIMRFAS